MLATYEAGLHPFGQSVTVFAECCTPRWFRHIETVQAVATREPLAVERVLTELEASYTMREERANHHHQDATRVASADMTFF
jgi:hypothetical protein